MPQHDPAQTFRLDAANGARKYLNLAERHRVLTATLALEPDGALFALTLCQITGRRASPRGLRHAFGVGTLQSGVPLNLTQRWLGHAKIDTTAIYAAACGPDERQFVERFWGN